jgi:hypothetical protein
MLPTILSKPVVPCTYIFLSFCMISLQEHLSVDDFLDKFDEIASGDDDDDDDAPLYTKAPAKKIAAVKGKAKGKNTEKSSKNATAMAAAVAAAQSEGKVEISNGSAAAESDDEEEDDDIEKEQAKLKRLADRHKLELEELKRT